MFSLLLAIIYVAFISLGLPDSLLGSAWPVMRLSLDAPFSYAGIITMIISACTIVSSLFSSKLTSKIGPGMLTAVSVLLTALAMLGFSLSREFWHLCLLAIPYGLGAGGVDATLNNYVALHYTSRHMSWLHCFWGVGAIISPYIMAACLSGEMSWNGGFQIVSMIQLVLSAVMFAVLPLWRKNQIRTPSGEEPITTKALSFKQIFRIKGVALWLFAFFAYCAMEQTTMLWASSYLSSYRNVAADSAASFASLVYIGLTAGRFVAGFFSERLGDKSLIRIGSGIIIVGLALIALPISHNITALIGLVVVGIGCAPIYPSIIHATPDNFGKENSQSIIGVQMAAAYIGTTFMPYLFGLIAQHISIALYPIYLIIFAVLMIVVQELFHLIKKRENKGIGTTN